MKKNKPNKPLLYDPLILPRVKQYLEDNIDNSFLDVGDMAKSLQERYPEYSRRKSSPFRALVEQAYRIVSESYGLNSQPASGDESDESDLQVMDDSTSNNLMSNMMNNLYSKLNANNPSVNTNTTKQSEAIDISSDESGDETTTNGKSTQKESSAAAVMKGSRNVTVTKLVNTDGSSKNSSSGTPQTNADVVVTLMQQIAQKRHEPSEVAAPPKKRKLDEADKTDDNGTQQKRPQQQQQQPQQHHRQQMHSQQLQQMQRMPNINQNSNDSISQLHQQLNSKHNTMRPRKYKKEIQLRKSQETFQDVGGMERTLKELCELLIHIKVPDIYFALGVMPPRGILLHGPSGCGKTLLAHAIAGQLNLPLIEIAATELIAGVTGESEERIRDVFEQAAAWAPCVLFIDEIDAISSNRSMAQKDMDRRVVAQLISSLDSLKLTEGGQSVLFVGATTRPDAIDPALRRVGRFDHEVAIGIPTRKDRKDILTVICENLAVERKLDFDKIAVLTPGYVGADLLALVSRAASIAVKRKCAEQMREFQAKRNITIVDLDDDDEADKTNKSESDMNTEVTKGTEDEAQQKESSEDKDKNDEGDNADKENAVADNANKEQVRSVSDTAEKEMHLDPENGTTESAAIEKVSASANVATEDAAKEGGAKDESKGTEMNGAPEDTMDVDDDSAILGVVTTSDETIGEQGTDAEDQTEGVKKDVADTTGICLNMGEPTLVELLNWLDNPEDFVSDVFITFEDFREAIKVVQPSAKREGFITVPDVTWDDIGSLDEIREELKLAVLAPVKFPEKLARLGLSAPSGVLLCGPPGCGKTLLAKAVANEAGINFLSVKGPELMNMYVGESERAVRSCFQRARNSAPCVIFFDEFDSLCPKRSSGADGGSGTRIVNQLLTEMDGVEDRKGVYILAATNRPDIIDPAILRPGRLDTILYVGLPEQKDREAILRATTKNGKRPALKEDVDFVQLAEQTEGYTGADLAGLVRQAAMLALKESLNDSKSKIQDLCTQNKHFQLALKMLRPSVSEQDRKMYEKLRIKYAAPRAPAVDDAVE